MPTDTENQEQSFLQSYIIWILVGLVVIAVISIAAVVWFYSSKFTGDISSDHNVWGLFGDYLGGTLNPLLSFFGLIALLFTIVLQNHELRISRDELKETRIAQQASGKALEGQLDTMQMQLSQMRTESNATYYYKAMEALDSLEFRKAVDQMYRIKGLGSPVESWDGSIKSFAHQVFSVFNVVGGECKV